MMIYCLLCLVCFRLRERYITCRQLRLPCLSHSLCWCRRGRASTGPTPWTPWPGPGAWPPTLPSPAPSLTGTEERGYQMGLQYKQVIFQRKECIYQNIRWCVKWRCELDNNWAVTELEGCKVSGSDQVSEVSPRLRRIVRNPHKMPPRQTQPVDWSGAWVAGEWLQTMEVR